MGIDEVAHSHAVASDEKDGGATLEMVDYPSGMRSPAAAATADLDELPEPHVSLSTIMAVFVSNTIHTYPPSLKPQMAGQHEKKERENNFVPNTYT